MGKGSKVFQAVLFSFLLVLSACTEKSLDIEVSQDACKRFKISGPSYRLIEDPCTDSVKLSAQIEFSFNRSADCLDQVNNIPTFYNRSNQTLNALDFKNPIPRAEINITDDRATYSFEATFSRDIGAALNHLILDFNTQNELGVESNDLQIRINTSCSFVDPSAYDVNSKEVDLARDQSVFTIRLWDNAAEDGDIVSVYLNGIWLIENHSLIKAGTDFNFSTSLLNPGKNDLVVFALNEGSSGPNTVSIAVNGEEIQNFKPGLLTGEAVRINF